LVFSNASLARPAVRQVDRQAKAGRNTMANATDAKSVDADVFVDRQIAEDNITRTAGW
jgi:hypothetical protein